MPTLVITGGRTGAWNVAVVCAIASDGVNVMQRETKAERKVLAFLESNAPWLMSMDPKRIMDRIHLELRHGEMVGRSMDDSLLVARAVLRREYEDARRTTSRSNPTG
jgi:hypothetical protein